MAEIINELELDQDSIVAALLHDCIEDTDSTHDEIARLFGPQVFRARSSSSHFSFCIPSRWAMGAYTSMVSRDFSFCFLSDWYWSVRILWSRSADAGPD